VDWRVLEHKGNKLHPVAWTRCRCGRGWSRCPTWRPTHTCTSH